jgi:uncharacterized heparinase superfamily protein
MAQGEWTPAPEGAPCMLEPCKFKFLNATGEVRDTKGWSQARLGALWMYNLHYFDDLNAREATTRASWHRKLIERWITENPPRLKPGWDPYPTSRRIVNWIKWSLAGNELSELALRSMTVQAAWLCRRLEYHLMANHLFANAKGLVFAGFFYKGMEAQKWLSSGMEILTQEIPEQILGDGGHFERSLMYHSIILEDLLDLINICKVYKAYVPKGWVDAAQRMLCFLQDLTHPDGEIALFNDAAFGVAPRPEELVAYAERLGLATPSCTNERLRVFKDTGYVRWQKGEALAFLDAAPIGPDYQPGHGHADTLTFELSLFGQRVVVDTGTSLYGTDLERLRQRGTDAHNTVVVDGKDSSEIWAGFRVARRAYPFDLQIIKSDTESIVRCSHDGYKRLWGQQVHTREWRMRDGSLIMLDTISGRHTNAISLLHFHPLVALSKMGDYIRADLPGGNSLVIHIIKGDFEIQPSSWHPEFGKDIASMKISIALIEGQSKVMFKW